MVGLPFLAWQLRSEQAEVCITGHAKQAALTTPGRAGCAAGKGSGPKQEDMKYMYNSTPGQEPRWISADMQVCHWKIGRKCHLLRVNSCWARTDL